MQLRRIARHLGSVIALATWLLGQAFAQASATPSPLPSFAELEAAGARIGEIRIAARDVFDTSDPIEDKWLFRWANALHIQTRAGVIERALLFKPGDALSVRLLEETERLLRSNRYVYDVQFRPLAVHDGVVDIEVATRDTWTLDPGVSAGRSGGTNTGGVHLKEYNLLGTGIALGYARSSSVDRRSNEYQFSNDRVFGSRVALGYSHATSSDGRRNTASMVRPFYALDARWAAGITATEDDRIDAVYQAGKVASQYRHHLRQAEVFGGWSAGLEDGWVQRWSLGLSLQDDAYTAEPGLAAPSSLPPDQKLAGPFVRHEWIEDRYERELNRNLIGRPEFFALGFASTAQLGWAAPGLGSSRQAWQYSASVSRGFEPAPGDRLIASARVSGQISDGLARGQRLGGQAQYYLPQSPHRLFYAAASADVLTRPAGGDALLLGGDNGLRGYPLRYQSGTRRALFTVEERFYTDLYVWQLFRIGGAAFLDVGRAWGGGEAAGVNTVKPGWLSNLGAGLRIVSARAAFSNVLHIDIAFPLDADVDVKRLQFLVKTKTSF
jgi:hypothetical protein